MRKLGNMIVCIGLLLCAAALSLTGYNVWDSNRAGEASQAVLGDLLLLMEQPAVSDGFIPERENAAPEAEKNTEAAAQETQEETTEENSEGESEDASEEPPEIHADVNGPLIMDLVGSEFYENREMPRVTIYGNEYIGYLQVPSCKVELPVMAEGDYDKLKVAPCRFSGNIYTDTMVIGGHNYLSHFSPLKYIAIDAEVIFTDVAGNEFRYLVTSVESLQPNQKEEMITGDWDLTLFTCYAGGETRCTIRCDRVK